MKFFGVSKKVLLLVLSACALVFAGALSAYAEPGYVEFEESIDGERYLLKVSSVENRGSYYVAWVKTILPRNRRGGYNMELYAANKTRRQLQILSQTCYDRNGNVISSDSWRFDSYEWDDCVPDAVDESIWETIIRYGRRR